MKHGTKFHKTFHLPFNMTKFFIFALVSLLVMSTVFAVDIAYIVKTDYAADEGILRMLQEKNMSYSVIADDDINRAKLSNYSVHAAILQFEKSWTSYLLFTVRFYG